MKNKMIYLSSRKVISNKLSYLTVLLVIALSGCDGGGIIGTGTGPSTELYELKNLPDRISPDIPKTLLKGEELTPQDTGVNENADIFFRNEGDSQEKSEGWQELNFELYLVAFMRLVVENNATIVDLAFENILAECETQPVNCTIPSDRIRVTITQDVVNRLIELHTDWAESLPPQFAVVDEGENLNELIVTKFTSLLNKEVVLGETIYSRLDGAPYDHSIQTTLIRGAEQSDDIALPRWKDEVFYARWHEDGGVAKFITQSEIWPNQEYFYQNNTPSELVVTKFMFADSEDTQDGLYAKVIGADQSEAGILLELASISNTYSTSSSQTTSFIGRSYGVFQAQMDNNGGYSLRDEYDYELIGDQNPSFYYGYRESFDHIGQLLAGERCYVNLGAAAVGNCDVSSFEAYGPEGAKVTDSPYYFDRGDFDSLTAIQDAIRWKVDGLTDDVQGIVVVSANSTLALSAREPYCRGVQVSPSDMRLFCSATDEQLDNVVVLELINGAIGAIIPSAKLVQIQ